MAEAQAPASVAETKEALAKASYLADESAAYRVIGGRGVRAFPMVIRDSILTQHSVLRGEMVHRRGAQVDLPVTCRSQDERELRDAARRGGCEGTDAVFVVRIC